MPLAACLSPPDEAFSVPMLFVIVLAAAVAGAGIAGTLIWRGQTRRAREALDAARLEAQALRRAAELETDAAAVQAAGAGAREDALDLRAAADRELSARLDDLYRREERAAAREAGAEKDAERV